jgi:hypothetical protein
VHLNVQFSVLRKHLIWFRGRVGCFAQDIADRCNIKRYCLLSSRIHVLSVMFHLVHFNAEGRIPMKLKDDPFLIPNFPPIPPCDFSACQHADNKTPNSHIFLHDISSSLWKSAGVLVNSVYGYWRSMPIPCGRLTKWGSVTYPGCFGTVALVLGHSMVRIGSSSRQKSLRRRTISFILHITIDRKKLNVGSHEYGRCFLSFSAYILSKCNTSGIIWNWVRNRRN